jgi:putative toxin-antitoxin system antitoxin component (TIGR02293 family)
MTGALKQGAAETSELQKVSELLGGAKLLAASPKDALDAHDLIARGLPASALDHLVGRLIIIDKTDSLEKAVGMSLRTYQRRKDAPAKPLSQEQSGRAWKFAEILTKATAVFGSQAEAERWLESPAIGLDQRRPLDLLSTPAGVELVEDHLARLEYGVYA